MRDHTSGANVEELLRQSRMELQWIQRQLALIAARNMHHHHLHSKGKVLLDHILYACVTTTTATTAKFKKKYIYSKYT